MLFTAGKGMIRERAKLPDEVSEGDYDVDYYLNNQIIPSVDKIFEALGVDINKEIDQKEQSSLSKFI